MSGSNLPLYYVDACILTHHLTGEQRTVKEEQDGVAKLIDDFDKKLIHLATSSLCIMEVMKGQNEFVKLRGIRNFHMYAIDDAVLQIALEIREYYQVIGDGYPTFSTPDAIHIATAIHYQADVLYTFDGIKRGSRSHPRKLLGTVSPIAGKYPLRIEKPSYVPPVSNPTLFDDEGDIFTKDGNFNFDESKDEAELLDDADLLIPNGDAENAVELTEESSMVETNEKLTEEADNA